MTKHRTVPVELTEGMQRAMGFSPMAACARWQDVLAAAPDVNPWVSVKERLPEIDAEYFVWYEGNSPSYLPSTNFWYGGWIEGCPSHWWDESILPIPRPKK